MKAYGEGYKAGALDKDGKPRIHDVEDPLGKAVMDIFSAIFFDK
jgi:hypothetical protein